MCHNPYLRLDPPRVLALLVTKGYADVNQANDDGDTPLMIIGIYNVIFQNRESMVDVICY